MVENSIPAALRGASTRRQTIAGIALTFGGLVAARSIWAEAQQQNMKEARARRQTGLEPRFTRKLN